MRTRTTNSHVPTVGHRVESPDTTLSGEPHLTQIEKSTFTCDCCPECGEGFDESAGVSPRLVEELPDPQPPEVTQYNRHHYECYSCGAETVASHPDCPDEGQFG